MDGKLTNKETRKVPLTKLGLKTYRTMNAINVLFTYTECQTHLINFPNIAFPSEVQVHDDH